MKPKTIGRYEIKFKLGQGGMAAVYYAHDPRFKRDVAIKVLPPELLHSEDYRIRFEREARTIAALEHSAIVPVYDFGEENGQPYLVMRLMLGGSLGERIKSRPLSLAEIAAIVARVGSALDRAHEKGIIHRDVKVSNILFDQDGDAYLSDFGLAKLAEASAQLSGSSVVGTPAYMAPEMADPGGLSHLVDIYALGVTIYQALTGKLPYEASAPVGYLVAHATKPIPNILSLRPDLPPQIQPIIERVMAKNPAHRYQSAKLLIADLQAVAQQAEPISVSSPLPVGPSLPSRPDDTLITPPTPSQQYLRTLMGHSGKVQGLAWSPDGARLVSGAWDSKLIVWDVANGRVVRSLEGHTDGISSLAWSPKGDRLASGSEDSTAIIWDPQNGARLYILSGHRLAVTDVAWSPDGFTLASGGWDGSIILWNARVGKLLRTLGGQNTAIDSLAWSPNGTALAAGLWDGTVILWSARDGSMLSFLRGHTRDVWDLAWSPNGAILASCSDDATIILWDAQNNTRLYTLQEHKGGVTSLAWAPDGIRLASGSIDGAIILWDTKSGRPLQRLIGSSADVVCLAFSPEGDKLAAGMADGAVILWSI